MEMLDWSASVQACTKCDLHKFAQRKVIMRGSIPATVLFVGEAPGKTENVMGEPFVGSAGAIFDGWVKRLDLPVPWAVTNPVMCLPFASTGKKEEPKPEHLAACRMHFLTLIGYLQPKCLVAMGNVARQACSELFGFPVFHIPHPMFYRYSGRDDGPDVARLRGELHAFLSTTVSKPI
jgi:DNA polymerase